VAPDGTPVEGVVVTAQLGAQKRNSRPTDASGEFQLFPLPRGAHDLTAIASPRRDGERWVARGPASKGTWRAEAANVTSGASGVVLRFERGPRIEGRVEGLSTFPRGHVHARRTVNAESTEESAKLRVPIERDGSFVLEGLEPGPWTVFAVTGDGNHSAPLEAHVSAPSTGITLRVPSPSTVRGSVQRKDGTWVARGDVQLTCSGLPKRLHPHVHAARIGRDGAFELEGCPPGAARIVASSDRDGDSFPRNVTLEEGSVVQLELRVGEAPAVGPKLLSPERGRK
jgi:hypothetical protein